MLPPRHLPAALALTCAIAGCGDPAAQKVKIGANFELTGDIQAVGTSAKNAAELFFERLNAEGGVALAQGPAPAELVVRDNGAQAAQAGDAAQQLILRDKVVAMIGPNSDTCAAAAGDIAEKLKCVMVSPWSTGPDTTRDKASGAPKRHVFRACLTGVGQARAMAEFALGRLGAKKGAALYDGTSAEASSQASAFRDAFASGGGTVVASETYAAGDGDLSRQLAAIRAGALDVIFLPSRPDEAAVIALKARRLGIKAPLLGTDAWNSPAALAAGSLDGSYFVGAFSGSDEAREFAVAYAAKYGHAPDDVAALTYDACALVVEALEKSGENSREAVREALAQLRGFRGVTGVFQFEPGSGDPLKSAPLMRITGGAAVPAEGDLP